MDDADDLLEQANRLNRSLEGKDLFNAGGFELDSLESSNHLPPLEIGRKVVIVNEPSSLCLGLIHGGRRVCLDGASCTIASHRQKGKQWIPEDTTVSPFFLVSGPNGKNNTPTGYLNPILPTGLLEPDLVSFLLESESDDIGAMLNVVWDRGIRFVSELEDVQKAPMTVKKLLKTAKSPAKIADRTQSQDIMNRIRNFHDDAMDAFSPKILEDFATKLKEFSTTDGAYGENLSQTIEYLSNTLNSITKAVKGCIKSVQVHASLRTTEMKILSDTTEHLNSSLEQVASTLGKRSADAAGLSEPNLWSFAASTRTTQNDLKGAVQNILASLSHFTSQLKSMQSKVAKLEQSIHSKDDNDVDMESQYFGDKLNSEAPHSTARIQNGILRAPNKSESDSSMSGVDGIRVTGGGNYLRGGGNGGGYDGGGNNTEVGVHPQGGISEIWKCLNGHENRIGKLERRKKNDGTDSIFWHGHTFHAPEDIGAFFDKVVGSSHLIYFGCFANPYQLLDECTRKMSSQLKSTKEMKEILALQLRQVELRSYLSLDSGMNLPYLFAHSDRLSGFSYLTKPSKTADARFPACPSSTDFATLEDQKGLYPALIQNLKLVKAGIAKDIERQYRHYPVLQMLATQMLTTSSTFVEDLLSFMSQTHISLVKSFNTDTKAWDCICQSVEDLWTSQLAPATTGMTSADLADRKVFSSLCMWTSLKVTSIAEELSSNKISSHPDITSSYVRFLIEHVGSGQSSALTDALGLIADLKTELSKTRSELQALKGQVSAVESRVDKAAKKK